MDNSQLSGLGVFASGVHPVELSVGQRISSEHRVPVLAAVDEATGEVRLYIDPDAIELLRRDTNGG